MIDRADRDAFLRRIDEELMDDFLARVYGHNAMETADTSDLELSKIELQFLADACIGAHNDARHAGNFVEALIQYRLLQKLIRLDDELAELHEEAQSVNPIAELFDNL